MKKKVFREKYAIPKQDEIYNKEKLVKEVAKEVVKKTTKKDTDTKKKVGK